MTQRLLVAGLAVAAMAVTCGGNGAAFTSGVNKDAELGSLSEDDARKVCTALQTFLTDNFAPDIKELSCRGAGLTAGAFVSGGLPQKQAACTTAYDQCLARPANDPIGSSCEKPASTCRATVGELEACINDMVPILDQVKGALPTCQEFTGGIPSLPSNLEQPASCKTVDSKCEDLDLPTFPN